MWNKKNIGGNKMSKAQKILRMVEKKNIYDLFQQVWKKSSVVKVKQFLRMSTPRELESLENEVIKSLRNRDIKDWEELEAIITNNFIDKYLKKIR